MAESDIPEEAASLAPEVRLEHIYLKDVSFESPLAPNVFTEPLEPKIQVDFNASTKSLGGARHEVVLTTRLEGKSGEGATAFIFEVQQAGIFGIEGFSQPQLHQVMGTFCLTTLFPYVRELIDSLALRGGFPPLKLAPINFDALYAQGVLRAQQGNSQAEGPEVAPES